MKDIAQCIGLWLAEGDNKTHQEITFTNNNPKLVKLFSKSIKRLFKGKKTRIYVYNHKKKKVTVDFDVSQINHYYDLRANKPYFIFRLYSKEAVIKWKLLVEKYLNTKKFFGAILQGFFAGEGSVKTGSHHQRCLRIAQKEEKVWLNRILNHFDISYTFRPKNRTYEISGRWNWKKAAKIGMADLHIEKKEKFWEAYNSYQEDHYPKRYLVDHLMMDLSQPKTTKELSVKYKRSFARVGETLSMLKKQGKIKSYRVRSKNYWTNNDNLIIISRVKNKYLEQLNSQKLKISELSRILKKDPKNVTRRLKELKKLGMITKGKDNKWEANHSIRENIMVL